MPIDVAAEVNSVPDEPGAPIPPDRIDPELVKLGRPRTSIGVVTAAGIVLLCGMALVKLAPDRRFASEPDQPRTVSVADIAAGQVAEDAHVVVDAEPLMVQAIRAGTARASLGLRVAPVRGGSQRVWLVLPGDGWTAPTLHGHVGRVRPLGELPFADSIRTFLASNPAPLFATASAVRAGFATGKVSSVGGEPLALHDGDRVGFDVTDPDAATVVCTYNDRHQTTTACNAALVAAGVVTTGPPQEGRNQVRFTVRAPDAVAATTSKLQTAALWGAYVEPISQHHETTWGKLKTSGPAGFTVDDATFAEDRLDLIGLYVVRALPDRALAVIVGERPADYWHVLPVTIVVAAIGLLFAWALVRGVKRDLWPARA